MTGRRCEDVRFGDLPDDCDQPGAYWKYLDRETGEPMHVTEDGNLTGTVWGFCAPIGGIGTLRLHTVREHEDGTITVAPGDGSSNSILFTGSHGRQWHGYIERGVWREC
jgi:hypothetical protein